MEQPLVKISIAGMVVAILSELLNVEIIKNIHVFSYAAPSVTSVCLVLSGCLVVTEILSRNIRKPLCKLGKKIKLDEQGILGLFVCMVSSIPVYSMYKYMNKKGKLCNAAAMVGGTGVIGSIMAFVTVNAKEILPFFFIAKFSSAIVAVVICFYVGRNKCEDIT